VSAAFAVLTFADARSATDQGVPKQGSSLSATEKLQEVTVSARRAKLAPRVRRFVNQIVVPENNGEDGIARWQVLPVCPLVSGLTGQHGEFILERLSEIARMTGVPLAGEHCRPNLYILVTPQPEGLLNAMEKRNRPFTFGYDASHYPLLETPAGVVNEFIKTPRVVRVWYNSDKRDPWGRPLSYCRLSDVLPGTQKIQQIYIRCGHGTAGGSHLTLSAMTTFSRVFVIVDRSRLHGVTFEQLTAYVAMVGFAKLTPGARLGDAPTILKLFTGAPQAAPADLTEWDQAFLKSLYATEQLAKGQSGQIARAMVREIVP
jgi:hypothetical protein